MSNGIIVSNYRKIIKNKKKDKKITRNDKQKQKKQ
jgi:hypothetical protein